MIGICWNCKWATVLKDLPPFYCAKCGEEFKEIKIYTIGMVPLEFKRLLLL